MSCNGSRMRQDVDTRRYVQLGHRFNEREDKVVVEETHENRSNLAENDWIGELSYKLLLKAHSLCMIGMAFSESRVEKRSSRRRSKQTRSLRRRSLTSATATTAA